MNQDVYERAPRSAAQITFVGFLGACGGAAAALDEPGTASSDTGLDTEAALTSTNVACADRACRAAVRAAWPRGDQNWWGLGTPRAHTPTSDAALAACCTRLLPHYDADAGMDYFTKLDEWRTSGCCSAVRGTGSPEAQMACTPWGPPMPRAARKRGVA